MTFINFSSEQYPMQASKWLKNQVLLDAHEMEAFLSDLGNFYIFTTGCTTPSGESGLSRQDFLENYQTYITRLKRGLLPDDRLYRGIFSSVFTVASDHLFVMPAVNGQQILRVAKPIIQLQYHRMGHSAVDGKFRPMVHGKDSIVWGIQLSYPQLYRDPLTNRIEKVEISEKFPNTQLYRNIQKWLRQHTVPTPFCINEVVVNVPMRLGKGCLSWINRHPQLVARGISVKVCKKEEM